MSTYIRRAAVAFGLCAAACAANTPPSAQCAAPVPPPPPAQELEGGRVEASAESTDTPLPEAESAPAEAPPVEVPLHLPKPPIGAERLVEQDCPMDLFGATLAAEPIEGGMALVFRSVEVEPKEVRLRVAALASAYADLTVAGVTGEVEEEPASDESLRVDVEMIQNGALLEIQVPDSPGAAEAIPALRALLGRHADWMASTRQCPAVRAAGEPG